MTGFTTKKFLFFGSDTVGPFRYHTGEALVLALPFSFALIKVAETKLSTLLSLIRQGEADGQWRFQFGNEVALAVQKGYVQDGAGQGERLRDTARGITHKESHQSGVGMVT